MLSEKNKLFKRGLNFQAEALASRIGEEIVKLNSASLSGLESCEGGAKEM